MTYATLPTSYGWQLLHIDNDEARVIANVGPDADLAAKLRDWLILGDRIDTLLERHGLVDVPLDDLEETPG